MWGSVLKTFGRGSVKKVTSNKLLGRGGKKDQRRQRVQGIMEGEGSSVDKSQNPKISSSSGIVSPTSPTIESSGGSSDGIKGSLLRIKTSTVNIDTILKGSLKLDKLRAEKKRKDTQNQLRAQRERKLEKEDKKTMGLGVKNLLPRMGFFDKVKNFIVNLIFGWLAIGMLKWAPQLAKILPALGKAVGTMITWGGKLLDGIAWMIGKGYEAIDSFKQGVGRIFGDQGVKLFDKFGDVFKTFVNTALIAMMVGAKAGMLSTSASKMGPLTMIFRRGILAAPKRTLIWLFGKKGASAILTKTTAIAGWAKASALPALAAGAKIVGIVVAAAGLLAALGEGGAQLMKIGEGWSAKAKEAHKNSEDKKWWDPRKYFWGVSAAVLDFSTRMSGGFFGLLDILGTPFRLIYNAIRWPFMNDNQRQQTAKDMEKFDARVREQFRMFFNMFDFLGKVSDEKGSWGSWDHDPRTKGTEEMGYENKKKHKGGFIPITGTYTLKRKEIVIDPDSAEPAKEMLLAINQANTRTGVIEAIKEYAPYEAGLNSSNVIIPISMASIGNNNSNESTTSLSISSSDEGVDVYRGLYQGGLVA